MTKEKMAKVLSEGIKAANLSVSPDIQAKLIVYIETLAKWNQVYNLTAITDPVEMIEKHLLDSLIVSSYLGPGKMIDVGTGAGLPGIPLALIHPEKSFVLLDSHQKKITFVEHMILSLKLTNAVSVCARVEQYRPLEPFDWVISRAFASLGDFARLAGHLCKPGGRLVAMKGLVTETELSEVLPPFKVEKVEFIEVPGLEAVRSLVWMKVEDR